MKKTVLALAAATTMLVGCATAPADGQKSVDRAIDKLRDSRSVEDQIAILELQSGGRLGVAWMQGGRMMVNYRGEERFAMCSTFKTLLAAETLRRYGAKRGGLDRRIPIRASDVIEYSPKVKAAYDMNPMRARMSLRELAGAAVEVSDNGAANILMREMGGPQVVTAYAERNGDHVTRLDRTEPALNENGLGDARDSTSPVAMATLIERTALGSALPRASREQLVSWLVNSTTGAKRIRAGLPTGWRAGDKTGSCGTAFNDVAVLWDASGKASVLAVYLDRPTVKDPDAVIANVAKLVTNAQLSHRLPETRRLAIR